MSKPHDYTGKISIISPSGVINPELIDGAANRLKTWGYEVSEGRYARTQYGRYAGTETQRLHDLQKALDDDSLTAILCSRGGYGLTQIIDKVDFSRLRQHPKWLIGFSDITVIHAALSKLNIPSIHGVMAKHLVEMPDDALSLQYLNLILRGEKPVYHVSPHEINREGEARAKLIGGNLSVLMGLRGTPYEPDFANAILFIEDIAEEAYHIDRMMQNLRLGGVFRKISGLIVGHFTNCTEDMLMHKTVMQIISGAVQDYNFPVCAGFPAGHEAGNWPLIMGGEASFKVDSAGATLRFN